jgi:hypothetical protein
VAGGTIAIEPNQSYAETRESLSSGISWCSEQRLNESNLYRELLSLGALTGSGHGKIATGIVPWT